MLLGVCDGLTWSTTDPNVWFAPWLDVACRRKLDVLRFDVNFAAMPTDQYLGQCFSMLASRNVLPLVAMVGPSNPTAAPDPFVFAAAAQHVASLMTTGYLEIWNEPNLAPKFWPTPASPTGYAHLVDGSYGAIKLANPRVSVLAGSVVWNDQAFLNGFLAAQPQVAFDGLSVHPYSAGFTGPPDSATSWYSMTGVLTNTRAALDAAGRKSTPIWISELGYDLSTPTNEEQAASNFRAARDIADKAGVAGFCAYHLGARQDSGAGRSMALLRSDKSETLAWQAFMAGRS